MKKTDSLDASGGGKPVARDEDDEVEEEEEEENGLELKAFVASSSSASTERAKGAKASLETKRGGQKRRSFVSGLVEALVPPSPLTHPHQDLHYDRAPVHAHSSDIDEDEYEYDEDSAEYGETLKTADTTTLTPLHSTGTASQPQVAVNIFISFVGAGLLGQPYAFRQSGWLLGSIALASVSAANIYSMLLLVKCRQHLEKTLPKNSDLVIAGYGDLGRHVMGPRGEAFVNLCLVVSQVGFATAYIIFISANVHNISNGTIPRAYVCFGCVPILSLLVQARSMKTLSPFSLLADMSNLFGLSAVLIQDFEFYTHSDTIEATNFSGLLYVVSIALYSLEGVGLILPLESSCADRTKFPSLLIKVLTGITLLMISFGTCGYVAFGNATQAPITLNLEGEWATFVKMALCLALYLTYPIMVFPVSDVVEAAVGIGGDDGGDNGDSTANATRCSTSSVALRASMVLCTAAVAYAVPDFGKFLALVGSSICVILGFILPCYFHLRVFQGNVSWLEFLMDYGLILFGIVFGILGTIESVRKLVVD